MSGKENTRRKLRRRGESEEEMKKKSKKVGCTTRRIWSDKRSNNSPESSLQQWVYKMVLYLWPPSERKKKGEWKKVASKRRERSLPSRRFANLLLTSISEEAATKADLVVAVQASKITWYSAGSNSPTVHILQIYKLPTYYPTSSFTIEIRRTTLLNNIKSDPRILRLENWERARRIRFFFFFCFFAKSAPFLSLSLSLLFIAQ